MKVDKENGGFQKVMSLIEGLIHDNRKQLQSIRRINERVSGKCMITNNRLENRLNNFASLASYFKSRGALALTERSELQTLMGSRNSQATAYGASAKRLATENVAFLKKWNGKISDLNEAYTKVQAALKAVNDWAPKNTSFVETAIQESVDAYISVKKIPLKYDTGMIQLGASDGKIRQRLFEWLNMMKQAVIESLQYCKAQLTEHTKAWAELSNDLSCIVTDLEADAKIAKANIVSFDTLIKGYNDDEKVYSGLQAQSSTVLAANKKYCATEESNYKNAKKDMEDQLKIFIELKQWLRKNFSRVKDWVRKKYQKV